MSNHKRKEQIMAIFFNRVQRVNPRDPKGARKWYPVLKSIGNVDEHDVKNASGIR